MSHSALQFTLRQMQSHFADRRTGLGIVIVGTIMGLAGPFGTFDATPLLPRLLYWCAICLVSYATGFAGTTLLYEVLKHRLRPSWLALGLAGLVPGIPIALLVQLINAISIAPAAPDLIGLSTLLLYCPLLSLAVTVASALLHRPPATQSLDEPAAPALLERLPRPIRGRLLHLAVADHYVDVTTDQGHALVLIRLSDAMRETAPILGLQVHRSHWVALDAVRRSTRQAGKPMLELQNGTLVPVSRSFLPAARAAGLL